VSESAAEPPNVLPGLAADGTTFFEAGEGICKKTAQTMNRKMMNTRLKEVRASNSYAASAP